LRLLSRVLVPCFRVKNICQTLWNFALLQFLDASNSCPNPVSGEYSPIFHLTGKHWDVLSSALVNLRCLSSYISRSRGSHSLPMESLVLLSELRKTVPSSCIFHLVVFIACTGVPRCIGDFISTECSRVLCQFNPCELCL
jgi:hypothetical protein